MYEANKKSPLDSFSASCTNTQPEAAPLSPQGLVSRFWSDYHSKAPGKVISVLSPSLYESSVELEPIPRSHEALSYEEAAQQCRSDLQFIVKECERTNNKFSDLDFDIDKDFSAHDDNCLLGIIRAGDDDEEHCTKPGSVHRIPWIFEKPHFVANDFVSDLRQGSSRNCWWLAALTTVSFRKELVKKLCIARNEECGVYGFVFYRDGGWISTMVDDNLYLTQEDFNQDVYDGTGRRAGLYRKQKQTGSDALFFSRCGDANETWLPLLEKAFAKAHGDYAALDYGWAGTALEDLTGGVTTVIRGDSVLRKELLWRELLNSGDGEFLFSLSTGSQGAKYRNGLILRHDYSVLEAAQIEDGRGNRVSLVKIRNPWGERCPSGHGEWSGAWSNGSPQWTPFMMEKLRHKFKDDGTFWMSFDDVLENFRWIYRTRLFDERWITTQRWMSVDVPWLGGHLKKKFVVEIQHRGIVVFVLSQLDDRYFQDLKGQYEFILHFTLRPLGSSTYICQAQSVHRLDRRSVNCEAMLEAGTYEVVPKIVAERDGHCMPVEKVVRMAARTNPAKLRQVGEQYDFAHAKVGATEDQRLSKGSESPTDRMSALPEISARSVICASGSSPEFESDTESEVDSDSESECETRSSKGRPWNAVCVIGLRVLAQHAGTSISTSGEQHW
ncbi:hypothetical protein NW762_012860 [Fusarium torreyae]|uniref:Calpain catalytic domain-containing protein n=1 Tax=Fusarium torreyae TaxID=1237075 RepID=A0A9W8RPK7_9HYPO|nr:hypothetical protein NW762_012860 [Fusarium torreyae]